MSAINPIRTAAAGAPRRARAAFVRGVELEPPPVREHDDVRRARLGEGAADQTLELQARGRECLDQRGVGVSQIDREKRDRAKHGPWRSNNGASSMVSMKSEGYEARCERGVWPL